MSKPTTVEQYVDALPADRKKAINALRKVIRDNLDEGFVEGMQYGSIGYYVPHDIYPAGYHCDPKQPLPFVGLASQKNHIGIYLMCVYADETERARFEKDWAKSGKKLDMGKSCVRVKTLDDIALDAVGKAIKRATTKRYIANYEKSIAGTAAGKKHLARKAKLEGGAAPSAAKRTKAAKKAVAKRAKTAKTAKRARR